MCRRRQPGPECAGAPRPAWPTNAGAWRRSDPARRGLPPGRARGLWLQQACGYPGRAGRDDSRGRCGAIERDRRIPPLPHSRQPADARSAREPRAAWCPLPARCARSSRTGRPAGSRAGRGRATPVHGQPIAGGAQRLPGNLPCPWPGSVALPDRIALCKYCREQHSRARGAPTRTSQTCGNGRKRDAAVQIPGPSSRSTRRQRMRAGGLMTVARGTCSCMPGASASQGTASTCPR